MLNLKKCKNSIILHILFFIISPKSFKLQRCTIPHFKALNPLFWPLAWLLTLGSIIFAACGKTSVHFFLLTLYVHWCQVLVYLWEDEIAWLFEPWKTTRLSPKSSGLSEEKFSKPLAKSVCQRPSFATRFTQLSLSLLPRDYSDMLLQSYVL